MQGEAEGRPGGLERCHQHFLLQRKREFESSCDFLLRGNFKWVRYMIMSCIDYKIILLFRKCFLSTCMSQVLCLMLDRL